MNSSGAGSSGTSGSATTGTGSGSTGASSSSQGSANDMSGVSGMSGSGMAAMQALQNASGAQFNTLFVSQMLSMHDAKLAELESAATSLTDPELKQAVTKAIPKVRMHRDMLSKMSKGGSTSGSASTSGAQQ